MTPAFMLILGGAVGSAAPASNSAPPNPAPSQTTRDTSDPPCSSQDARNIVVCGQRRQPDRLDPNVMEAGNEAQINSRSANTPTPAAQAACASANVCGKGLESIDWANVAVVAATTAVRAAKGKDWTRVFKSGGPDEYQLYRQAQQRRQAEAQERAAAEIKRRAEEEERQVHAGH